MSFHWPEFPATDPVLYFAIVTAVFLVVPVLFERLGVPGLIGLIVVGAAIGPNGANVLARDQVTQFLGTLGLLYLMFLVGLELDRDEFRRQRRPSLLFGVASFALPQLIGMGVGLALGFTMAPALLLGAMFASHTLVSYPIASRLGIVKSRSVTTALGGTLITDVLALLVLAVVVGASAGGVGWSFWLRLLASLGGFALIALWVVPLVGRWFFRQLGGNLSLEFAFIVAVLFAICFIAELVGIEPIIGALLTGLALNSFVPEQGALMARVRFAADTLFVPFFLLSVGMLVDVRSFASPSEWGIIAALVAGIAVSKAAAAFAVARMFGYRPEEGWILFGLSIAHAASTMAIVLVGYQIGLFGLPVVNAVVVVVLVTCLIGPWATSRWGREVALREEQRAQRPGRAASRILIPISHPKSRDSLIDLGILLRNPASSEPLMPLMVVREEGGLTEGYVAEAERMLGHAVLRGTAASAPVAPLTRVDQNVANGIARAVSETRASMVLIGWDGGRSVGPQLVFGSVLDQLLERTRTQVVVSRVAQPLNTVSRVLLIITPFSERHPGFGEAVRTVATIAQQLTSPIQVLVVGDRVETVERALVGLKLAPVLQFATPTSWRKLEGELEADLRPDDLVVLLSARRDTLPWHPRLERLPRMLASVTDRGGEEPGPLLVLYPPEPATEETGVIHRVVELQDYLDPGRVVAGMPRLPFDGALERLLDTEYGQQPVQREVILNALVRALLEDSAELRPGVALPHTRVPGLRRPLLFLGVSRDGIDFPHSTQPARVIFLLVSPREQADEHLHALSAVATLCADEARLAELMKSYGLDPLPPLDPP